jgi:hypothetical protein
MAFANRPQEQQVEVTGASFTGAVGTDHVNGMVEVDLSLATFMEKDIVTVVKRLQELTTKNEQVETVDSGDKPMRNAYNTEFKKEDDAILLVFFFLLNRQSSRKSAADFFTEFHSILTNPELFAHNPQIPPETWGQKFYDRFRHASKKEYVGRIQEFVSQFKSIYDNKDREPAVP